MSPKTFTRLLGFLALVAPAMARAQSDAPIPRDLVVALLQNYSGQSSRTGRPEIIVGGMPSGLLSKLATPPGAKVFGSVVWRNQTDILGQTSGSIDSVLAWYSRDFVARGYKASIDRYGQGPFRSSRPNAVTGFCDKDHFYSVRARPTLTDAFSTDFEIHVESNSGDCLGLGYGMSSGTSVVGLVPDDGQGYPLLYNPPNVQPTGKCMGPMFRSFSGPSSQTGYLTSATPAQPLGHYGRQLDSAGWKRETIPAPIVATYFKTDTAGKLRATLSISANPKDPNCKELQLEMTRITP